MANHHDNPMKRPSYVALPWLVAAASLAGYLLTLNGWISVLNLPVSARLAHFVPGSQLQQPCLFLATYPLRWLPAARIPVALNVFSALCGALTLALLARSVLLLPHDRTQDLRDREPSRMPMLHLPTSWIPPLLAALGMGMELGFWEQSTAGSVDLFDVLIFAYIVRCLLEFRNEDRPSWLWCAAFASGAGMADSWTLVLFFPLFVAAVVWLKGFGFFNLRFLLRILMWGVLGLLLYCLLPLLAGGGGAGFWQTLKFALNDQRQYVFGLWEHNRYVLILLSLTSVVPLFLVSLRWASFFGDTSPLGSNLTMWIFHLVHFFLLVVCLWVMFDPGFSPRAIATRLHAPVNLLMFYYISALVAGYLASYFLRTFGRYRSSLRQRHPAEMSYDKMSITVIVLLFIAVPAGLICKNLPQIRAANRPFLRQYAAFLTQELPPKAVLLSDGPVRLILAEAFLSAVGRAGDYTFLETGFLKSPEYHKFLKEKYGNRWDVPALAKQSTEYNYTELTDMLERLSQKEPVYYLHPSFGYYFERFYPVPHGLVDELNLYPTNAIFPPALTADQISRNESFWKNVDSALLADVVAAITEPESAKQQEFRDDLLKKLRVQYEPSPSGTFAGQLFSQPLNQWGVRVEQAGDFDLAAPHFARAVDLNPDNTVAARNLKFNEDWRAGKRPEVRLIQAVEDEFGHFGRWDTVLEADGFFDDPSLCFAQGRTFFLGSNFRQAAQQLRRAAELAPGSLLAQVWLQRAYIANHHPDEALENLAGLHRRLSEFEDAATNSYQIGLVEATAWFAKTNIEKANAALSEVARDFSTNRLAVDNAAKLWTTYGYVAMQMGSNDDAIAAFSRAVEVKTNNYVARWDRAIAYLRTDKLDAAERDYYALQAAFTNFVPVYYGLGEIAWRRKDTNAAIKYYQEYLTNAPAGSRETGFVSNRLNQLMAPH